METQATNEVFALITSFGATGVMFLWLWDVRTQLKAERDNHDRTRQKLEDALKDCNRMLQAEHDTRRLPAIPQADKDRFKQMMLGDE